MPITVKCSIVKEEHSKNQFINRRNEYGKDNPQKI